MHTTNAFFLLGTLGIAVFVVPPLSSRRRRRIRNHNHGKAACITFYSTIGVVKLMALGIAVFITLVANSIAVAIIYIFSRRGKIARYFACDK